MSWFSLKKNDIVGVDIPPDKNNPTNLSGRHPVLVTEDSEKDKQEFKGKGCSSKYQRKWDDVPIEKKPEPFRKETFVREGQGERTFNKNDITDRYQTKHLFGTKDEIS